MHTYLLVVISASAQKRVFSNGRLPKMWACVGGIMHETCIWRITHIYMDILPDYYVHHWAAPKHRNTHKDDLLVQIQLCKYFSVLLFRFAVASWWSPTPGRPTRGSTSALAPTWWERGRVRSLNSPCSVKIAGSPDYIFPNVAALHFVHPFSSQWF